MRLYEIDGTSETQLALAHQLVHDVCNNCPQFLTEIGFPHNKGWVYRGLSDFNYTSTNVLHQVRKDRKPLDTNKLDHAVIDEWTAKRFGFRARSQGLFGTADYRVASHFGKVCAIFPIGRYNYIWSNDILDMTETMGNIAGGVFRQESTVVRNDKINAMISDKLVSFLDDANWNYSVGLPELVAAKKPQEIIFECDKYYAIPLDSYANGNGVTLSMFKSVVYDMMERQ